MRLRGDKVAPASGAIGIKRCSVGLRRLESRRQRARHNEQPLTRGGECGLNGEWSHARQPLNGRAQTLTRCGKLRRCCNVKWDPCASGKFCGGARRTNLAHKVEPLIDAAHRAARSRMSRRPCRRRQESRVARASRERLPDSFRNERRNRVQQAQEIIERIHECPPDGGALRGRSRLVGERHLGNLNRLVAILRPDRIVNALRRLGEAVLAKRSINIINGGAEARRHPGAELPRRCMRIGSRWSITGCLNRSRAKHVPRGVPKLVHEVAGVL